jgi:long-subunit acyl-CoA synthetase (AMP-forming)
MFEDLAILRPTVLSSTPRLFNAIHNEYKKALAAALSRLRQRQLASLQPTGEPTGEPETTGEEEAEEEAGKGGEGGEEEEGVYARYLTPVEDEGDTEAEVERLVLRQFSKLLGGRVAVLVTGGAPTSPSVLQFLDKYATQHHSHTHTHTTHTHKHPRTHTHTHTRHDTHGWSAYWVVGGRCFQCMVFNGYGTTETAGIMTEGNVTGSVGTSSLWPSTHPSSRCS